MKNAQESSSSSSSRLWIISWSSTKGILLRWAIYGSIIGSMITTWFSVLSTSAALSIADGVFGQYFMNIINTACPTADGVVTEFSTNTSNYGAKLCRSFKSLLADKNIYADDTTGNIGIGTTTPGNDVAMLNGLSINGTNSTQLNVQKNGVSWFALNTNQSMAGDWVMYDKVWWLWRGSLSSSAGNIGVGLTSPSTRLDVNWYLRLRSTNGEGGTIQLDGNNGTNVFVENINGTFRLVNSPWNKELFSVDQNSNVGIWAWPWNGIGWPGSLNVNGSIRWARFYDDDTNYYIDANTTSKMNEINLSWNIHTSNSNGYYVNNVNYYGDGTNAAVRMPWSLYVQHQNGSSAANVIANDYYIGASGKWASQLGGWLAGVSLWSCWEKTYCDDGQVIQGSWASYGCLWQIAWQSSCINVWWYNGPHLCRNACTQIQ